ncbi:MAG: aminoacetone oxidase family FAD-binding enzyme [Lachnospiraceae bacterium]|nr:aminoacetone oxidase family FAD-binding enzyme [Lachnospiraceae bacterium]
MKKVFVIGGGASGITAAIFAAQAGAEVRVLEKENIPMKKLARTGNGKCNISNMKIEEHSFMSNNYMKAYDIYRQFDTTRTFAFFERLGIPVINKGRDELYPACESAASVVKILRLEAERLGVKIKNSEYVQDLDRNGGNFTLHTDHWEYKADSVIVACGTNASTGSEEEMLTEKLAAKYSLSFHKYLPALARLYSNGGFLKKWSGVRVFGVVRLLVDDVCVTENYGELQLTDCGISGIPIFDISRFVNIVYDMKKHSQELELDFFPDLSDEELTAEIQRICTGSGKTVRQALLGLIPEKLIHAIIREEDSPEAAAAAIKRFRMPVTAPSKISEAQVCTGGLDLDEISLDMECLKLPGLFFCGEALDADGMCGGFNLQWAWTTGALAGQKAAEFI